MSNDVPLEEKDPSNLIHRVYRMYCNCSNIVEKAEWEEKLKNLLEIRNNRKPIHITGVNEKKAILNDLKNAVLVSVARGCVANRRLTRLKGKSQTMLLEVYDAR